ncbi:MAG: MlaD family protein [Sphingomonadaceae bacterium]
METRSNQVLVGGAVLALLVALAAFIVWMTQASGEDRKEYDIFFQQAVDGLARGSQVVYSGVPVGQVENIALMPRSPEFVRVRITVREGTPVLEGTTATIEGVGFTGVSQIQLDPPSLAPGRPNPDPIVCPEENTKAHCPFGAPVIPTKPGALGQLLNSAPELLERVSTLTERLTELLSDTNQQSIAAILENSEEISNSLAARGPEIAATLAEAQIAIRQTGDAAAEIGQLADTTDTLLSEDARPLVNDMRLAVRRAEQSLEKIDRTVATTEEVVEEARPGLQTFSKQTIPEVGQLVRELRATSNALSSIARKLDEEGAASILAPPKLPDYEPED